MRSGIGLVEGALQRRVRNRARSGQPPGSRVDQPGRKRPRSQQLLAATVLRRRGRIRCYDLIPVVFKTIKHRQGIKSCLQARKAKSDLQEKAGLENEQAKAAAALLRRFGQA